MLTQSSSPPPKPPRRLRDTMPTATAAPSSGTSFMPSQRAGAAAPPDDSAGAVAAPPPSESGDPCCAPTSTVLHLSRSFAPIAAAAADGSEDPLFSIAGVEAPDVTVLGRVLSVVRRETDVLFTLHDGTGKINLVRPITDQPDALEAAYIQEGVYVKVHLRFQEKQHEVARCRWPSKLLAYPNDPLNLLSISKECRRGICIPVLLLSNYSDSGICCFLPYTKNSFKKVDVAFDIDDVLYSNGEWLLLREDKNIYFWEVNAEQKWFVAQVDDLVHQGHFIGKPPHEATIVLAKQDPPKVQKDAVTDLWLKIAGNNEWKKDSVRCTNEQSGLSSLTICQDKVFWLNDAGRLCCVKESSNGIRFMVCKSGIGGQCQNLSLVEHCNGLYVVSSSGGFLPLQVTITHQVTNEGSFPLLNGLSGKSIFTSPKQSGFVLSSLHNDDNKVYTANLLPNVDCAMYSYKSDVTESIRRCSYRHHLACSTAWAVLRIESLD